MGSGDSGAVVPSTDDALQLIAQVCAGFQGNLADHQNIQQALEIVTTALKMEPDKDDDAAV